MSDILDRHFGPEDPDQKFKPLDPAQIIPLHECEFVERSVWSWYGMVAIFQCPVCKTTQPR